MYILGLLVLLEVLGPPELANVVVSRSNLCQQSVCAYLFRRAFGQRRKTAANAIAGGLNLPKEKVIAAIEAAGFDARIRPEALTLEDFAKIQQALG